mmetsp:Transcript_7357/g.13383  ORF Transcript_7357/g.13383 Transcript_7357/m.13383 type:complete len:258 (+) Transcript_7357:3473-4246(+)
MAIKITKVMAITNSAMTREAEGDSGNGIGLKVVAITNLAVMWEAEVEADSGNRIDLTRTSIGRRVAVVTTTVAVPIINSSSLHSNMHTMTVAEETFGSSSHTNNNNIQMQGEEDQEDLMADCRSISRNISNSSSTVLLQVNIKTEEDEGLRPNNTVDIRNTNSSKGVRSNSRVSGEGVQGEEEVGIIIREVVRRRMEEGGALLPVVWAADLRRMVIILGTIANDRGMSSVVAIRGEIRDVAVGDHHLLLAVVIFGVS